MSLLLSIILPCYNVERFLQECLDSIYDCNLCDSDFEVLCIDDCSPDNSIVVLEKNAVFHSNLRIISHSVNKGLGGARNTGIQEARGRYLWFVDSDDKIIGNNLKSVLTKAIQEELDVLGFNYCRIDEKGDVLSDHIVFDEWSTQDGLSFVEKYFGESIVQHMGFVWRFIYRVDYLRDHHLTFPENRFWEDTVFMPQALINADRVASVSEVLYSYRVNQSSISGVFSRAYPARMIFDFSFVTGKDLLSFSETIGQEDFKAAFNNVAIQKYINGFPLLLMRTNHNSRKEFYKLLDNHRSEINLLRKKMGFICRVLVSPVGFGVSEVMSFFYELKKIAGC